MKDILITVDKEVANVARGVWRSIWSLHTTGERCSACELCAKMFSCGNNLKMHMKLTLGEILISGESADVVQKFSHVGRV